MNPMVKYTMARTALFALVAAVLVAVPLPVHVLVKLLIAVVVSFVLAFFVLRGMRDEVANHLAAAAQRRAESRERLRTALAGDDDRALQDEDEA